VVLPYDDEAAVDTLVEKHRDELACIMFDPKAGILPQRPEFVRAVGDIARRHNVLLVFDEIVGFRMGAGGLQAHYGIDPDLTCFGKIVGGGFPVGALGGRADILDLFDNTGAPTGFFQSGTFSAHPITMAAGLAMLGELTDEAFAHLNGLADRLRQGLHEMFARENIKAQMVHNGSVFSIYFTDAELRSYRDLAAVDRSLASPVFLALLEEEYFLSHGLGMCALSLPMEDGHIDGLVTAMQRAIERASQERE